MEHIKIEFLPNGEAQFTEKKQKDSRALKTLVRTSFYTLIFLLVGVASFTYRIAVLDTSVSGHASPTSLFTHVKNFMGFGSEFLTGIDDDRINILLMGQGGYGHEGPFLTDTIILTSIKPSTEQISLVSIPRDLVVWQDQYQWRKVNHANSFGEELKPGFGGEFASSVIGRALSQPIHYYIIADFTGLEKIIDILGGLNVTVERGFTDASYPTSDFMTTTVSFEAGKQTMNGEEVLQFVRSRHGTNGEGNDFARARRQQLVLESLKNQALSLDILLKPHKINSLLKTIDEHIQTNLTQDQISSFAGMIKKFESSETIRLGLDDSPDGYLRSLITEEGAYILTPRHGSFSEIAFAIEHIFTSENERPTPVRIAVRNGTPVTGLANLAAERLDEYNFFVTEIENAERKDWEQTSIYKLTGNAGNDEMTLLESVFGGTLSLGLPSWLEISNAVHTSTSTKTTIPPSDILVILGTNSIEKLSL